MSAQIIVKMARTHTTSSSVKPCSPARLSSAPAGDIACCTGSTLLSIGAIRNDVVGPMLSRGAVDVWPAPGVARDRLTLQVGAIPRRPAARRLHQCVQPFRAGWILSRIQKIEIERARQTFDLNFGGLGLGFTQVVEYAGSDQAHDERDDGYDHEDFDQREPSFGLPRGAPASISR